MRQIATKIQFRKKSELRNQQQNQNNGQYTFNNQLLPNAAAAQATAQPVAQTTNAPRMADPNFAPQMQTGQFSSNMSNYQAPQQVVNPTNSDTPLLNKNQNTFFDMPKNPTTPDGYTWDDNALRNYGFSGDELNRVKTADFSNPDTVNYYASQGWLRKNDPQSIEEVLSTPTPDVSGGGGYSGSTDNSPFTPPATPQPANENPTINATPQDSGAALDYDPAQQQLHEDILAEMKRRHGEDIVNSPYYDGIYDNIYNELKNPITFGQGQLNPFM